MVHFDRIEQARSFYPPCATDISTYQDKLAEIVRQEDKNALRAFEAVLIAEIVTLDRENTPMSEIRLHRIETMVDKMLNRRLSPAKNRLFTETYHRIKEALRTARTLH